MWTTVHTLSLHYYSSLGPLRHTFNSRSHSPHDAGDPGCTSRSDEELTDQGAGQADLALQRPSKEQQRERVGNESGDCRVDQTGHGLIGVGCSGSIRGLAKDGGGQEAAKALKTGNRAIDTSFQS